ncbi:MAG: hypothetical protein COT91_04845 [Candidatus Doudnabacteria bacterium CG10_big_fil_rev_8_21_14_0_10_41_10]|uniref:Uncharacterized protein n=1 Tax=Candidatus Doudnabacteria bacterium CG10_big_fil_rev_8_21_14_0_10_41_10 TaxID=1974551 RepID=A0A2H0VEM6_9BACT|nr:MAG: hypothetical protein COT91_04845 [Candidatus Doudnabacteria bacterium CG10_big_fil_rev_8_21_14_0_10_41_10]
MKDKKQDPISIRSELGSLLDPTSKRGSGKSEIKDNDRVVPLRKCPGQTRPDPDGFGDAA